MRKTNRFTLALTVALMASTSAAVPSFAQTDASGTTPVESSVSSSQAEAPSTNTASTTSTTSTAEAMDTPSISIAPESTVDNDTTHITIDMSYKGLVNGTQYDARFTITNDKGDAVDDSHDEKFTTEGKNGEHTFTLSLDGALGSAQVSVDIVDAEGNVVASLDEPVDVASSEGEDEQFGPGITTTASLNTDVIQTGSLVSDVVTYEGFVPGENYTVETALMCKADEQATGGTKVSEFTAEDSSGEFEVTDVEVKNPDCLEQVVFQVVKDSEGNLVAQHTDINDEAQTVGGGLEGKKKKKKPEATRQVASPVSTQAPAASAGAKADALGEPRLTPPQNGRALIGSVPSGEFSSYGKTIFDK